MILWFSNGSMADVKVKINSSGLVKSKRLCPGCSTTKKGQFPICKLKWDLLRTSVTTCIIDKDTFSAPFRIFYVRKEI